MEKGYNDMSRKELIIRLENQDKIILEISRKHPIILLGVLTAMIITEVLE